ncbi:MAG: type II toxin-antitoxin system VapC family toxin [Acidobacteriia bacterium]|nr:type II toxin-antitoxin system VapC family toxin [Terriglobia bacterium]
MTSYVVDASVAAKWFLPAAGEPHADQALQLLRDYTSASLGLIVPDLFWPEFGNILWKASRRQGRMSLRSAEAAIAEMGKLTIPTSSSMPLLSEAFAIAAAFDRTVYDAVYVALAVSTGAPLLTADERLANALATRFPVRWIGSYAGWQ